MTRPQPSPDTQPHRLSHYRFRWDEVGISTFPLTQNDKTPICTDWQTRLPDDQWAEAEQRIDTQGTQHNIAVRAGQLTTRPDTSIAIIDMDNPTARRHATAGLKRMGLDTVTVRTASRSGRHAYILVSGVPSHFNYTHLNTSIGKGEFRAGRGAYVTAPCSEIDGTCYVFMQGNIETLTTQRVIEWQDLQWLLPDVLPPPPTTEELPLKLQHRLVPAHTLSLLEWCANASKGEGIGNFATRSEAEAAVVAQLLGCGWERDEVIASFERHEPKHYVEQGKRRTQYLSRTYNKVLTWMCNTPIRQSLVDLYHTAPPAFNALAYRTNHTELAVFQALVAHCWRHNTAAVHASRRDLAEGAASTHTTVGTTLMKLQILGCVVFLKKSDRTKRIGEKWGVVGLPDTKGSITFHKSQKAAVSSKRVSVSSKQEDKHVAAPADAGLASRLSGLWSVRGGVRRSSKAVWMCLSDEPQTVKELIVATGKVKSTVGLALTELQTLGAASEVDGGHILGDVSMTEVAHVLGAQELTSRRRSRHTWEREAYAKWMKLSGGKG